MNIHNPNKNDEDEDMDFTPSTPSNILHLDSMLLMNDLKSTVIQIPSNETQSSLPKKEEDWILYQELDTLHRESEWLLVQELKRVSNTLFILVTRAQKILESQDHFLSFNAPLLYASTGPHDRPPSRFSGTIKVKGINIVDAELKIALYTAGKKQINFKTQITKNLPFILNQVQNSINYLSDCKSKIKSLIERQKELKIFFNEFVDLNLSNDVENFRTLKNDSSQNILEDISAVMSDICSLLVKSKQALEIPTPTRLPKTIKELTPSGNQPRMPEYSSFRSQPPADICINISISDFSVKLTALTMALLNSRPQQKLSHNNLVGQSFKVGEKWIEVIDQEDVFCELLSLKESMLCISQAYRACAEFHNKLTVLQSN